MSEREYVLISTDVEQVLQRLSAKESGHALTVIFDHWGNLDDVVAEEEFRDEPNLMREWPELKTYFTFGVEEEVEEDAEPDN